MAQGPQGPKCCDEYVMTVQLGPSDIERAWVTPANPPGTQVHAPTVLATSTGLVAAWFAGAKEGSEDTRIYVSRCVGGEWTTPEVVAPAPTAHWNPVLAYAPDEQLWLFFKRGPEISSWVTWFTTSADEGRTWASPRRLIPTDPGGDRGGVGGRGPVKNPPLRLGDAWLAPGSIETWDPVVEWEAFVDISTDGGREWRKTTIPVDRANLRGAGVIQPALWRGETGGVIHALMRSTEGWAFQSTSRDHGRTWDPAQPSSLPNNNSALAVVEVAPGTLACVYNATSGDWALRCPLHLAVSTDFGATWTPLIEIEDGRTPIDDDPRFTPVLPRAADAPVGADSGVLTAGVGEYSYPSLCVENEDLVICYTWQRQRIASARVPLTTIFTTLQKEEKD